ncbi:MAG: 16S rRNA (guanine(527)-N(7))-methyltransferase RsmG [Flavobacteriales bacterium]|nr:16S rRNA (guanine(527)-N(7))-methyltransferase RsmG [Flavobacteriales bacterium]
MECHEFGTPIPALTEQQRQQCAMLGPLFREWNARINVISRKDLDQFFTRHVLHSLSMARIFRPETGARILDVGTGGGFPGLPLAILFPDAAFTLCDSIGKKIKVVNAVSDALGLKNVEGKWARAESLTTDPPFDFVVSRAVTRMAPFLDWVRPLFAEEQRHGLPNGVLYLKGGDLSEELSAVQEPVQQWALSAVLDDPWFETKQLVHVAV